MANEADSHGRVARVIDDCGQKKPRCWAGEVPHVGIGGGSGIACDKKRVRIRSPPC